MSANIKNVIVHKLQKDAHGPASIELAEHTIQSVSQSSQRLVDQLLKLYVDKTSKGYGQFEDDEDNFPMKKFVRDYFEPLPNVQTDFYDFSCRLMRHLEARATQEPLATGGYALMVELEQSQKTLLLIALVTEVIGTAITKGLEIADSIHLDLNNLRVAGRVDVSAWQAKEERYLSFLKGRSDVSQYFKKFLGCNDYIASLKETQKLVGALKQFANDNIASQSDKDAFLTEAHSYISELCSKKEVLLLEPLANRLYPLDPARLCSALINGELQLSDGFQPDKRSLKSLVTFKGKTKHWTLEFDRSALSQGDVTFDQESNTLTIKNIPDELRQEIINDQNDESD